MIAICIAIDAVSIENAFDIFSSLLEVKESSAALKQRLPSKGGCMNKGTPPLIPVDWTAAYGTTRQWPIIEQFHVRLSRRALVS